MAEWTLLGLSLLNFLLPCDQKMYPYTGLWTFLNLLRLCAWCVCNFYKYFNLTRKVDIFLGRVLVSCTLLCKFVLYLFTLTFWLHCSCLYFWPLGLTKEDKREFQISQLNCFPVHFPLLPAAYWILESTLRELIQTRQGIPWWSSG